jgi:hypothetical protein
VPSPRIIIVYHESASGGIENFKVGHRQLP